MEGQRALEAAGRPAEDARRDAVLLARHVLGWDDAQWLTRARQEAAVGASTRFHTLIARRARHEPIAYLTGEREFYGRSFVVTPDVLIPRPETELIVDEALLRRSAEAPRTIVDVGTGSGCLAVTLALECPSARVVATDVSDAALTVARANAARHGVQDRIECLRGSLLAPARGPVDLIVANLPYVAERDRSTLPPEVADFEPATALFGGADGLDLVRTLLPEAAALLTPGGRLIFEIGQGQLNDVRDLIEATGNLVFRHARQDLQGIPRTVSADATLRA